MNSCCTWQRLLAVLATGVVFCGVIAVLLFGAPPITNTPVRADQKPVKAADAHHDWPLFGGSVERNMVNLVEKNVPTQWDVKSNQNIKWVADLGSKAYGGPIISGGKIFVGTNNDNPKNPRDREQGTKLPTDKGVLMCFDEATGKFLWQAVHDKLPAGRVNDWPREGICSSPVVEGKRLWYISNRCEVVCATTEGFLNGGNEGPFKDEQYKEKTDADFIWKLDMMDELGVFPHNLATCSPLIVGDTLFVITSNGVDEGHIKVPKPQAPSFLAIDKNTGKVLWSSNLPTKNLLAAGAELKKLSDRGLVIMHGQWSNPVYYDGKDGGVAQILFPGGNGWIYSFDPKTGDVIWKFDANPKNSTYSLGGKGTRNDFVASPVIHKGKLYIGVGQDPEHDRGVGRFWCVDVVKATKLKGDVSPELVASDDENGQKGKPNPNSAAVWEYGGLIDPPPEEGREYRFGRTMSTASVHDGLCFIGEQEGYLHCLDAETGKEYWQHDLNAATWSSPHYVDGKIFMGNDKNKLLIFEHGKTKKKIAEIDMKGKVRATPVVCNGVLYVMTENKLYAIAVK